MVRADVEAHGAELFHVVRRSLQDDELAREVVQDVFVRAWRSHERFDPARGSRRTWLFAIARNAVVDAVRHRGRRPKAVKEVDDHLASEDRLEDRVVLNLQLQIALRELSAEQRQAIVEVHRRGRPYVEVAEEVGVPVGTLRSRVYYGLRQLRTAMQAQGWNEDG